MTTFSTLSSIAANPAAYPTQAVWPPAVKKTDVEPQPTPLDPILKFHIRITRHLRDGYPLDYATLKEADWGKNVDPSHFQKSPEELQSLNDRMASVVAIRFQNLELDSDAILERSCGVSN
jgi:hypothetical protein